jgi:hypothetical protein
MINDIVIIMYSDKDILNIINNIDDYDLSPQSKSDLQCAPGLEFEAGSCFKLTILIEMAEAYNKTVEMNDKIKLSHNIEVLNPKKYKAYLVQELKKRMSDTCTTQKCWTKQEFIRHMNHRTREELEKYTFRPDSPQGKFEWLSTFNIEDAVKQYCKKYTDFKFFGAVPMDFAELPSLEISNANYDKYYNDGYRKFGVVFNLDNHNQSGSHWVAMYTNCNDGVIYYFDSFGKKPEARVRELMRIQAKFLLKIGHKLDNIRVDYNKVQHQKKNTECGVYSVNFIIRMLRGNDFDKLCNSPVSDKRINKCRKIYFNKYANKKD